MNGDDDILEGFGEGRPEISSRERPSDREVLEHARSSTMLRNATIAMYLALATPLPATLLPLYLGGDRFDNALIVLGLSGTALALVWVGLRNESLLDTPAEVEVNAASHRSLRRVWRVSLIGFATTAACSAVSVVMAMLWGLGLLVSDSALTMVLGVTVIVSVVAFLLPALFGFGALSKVFMQTEGALSDDIEETH